MKKIKQYKSFIIGLIVGLSFLSVGTFAATTQPGTIGSLFIDKTDTTYTEITSKVYRLYGDYIQNETIDESELAEGSVHTSEIKDGEVKKDDLDENIIDDREIENNSISSGSLATSSVGSDEIINESITSADIDDGEVKNIDIESVNASKVTSGTFGNGDYIFNNNLNILGKGFFKDGISTDHADFILGGYDEDQHITATSAGIGFNEDGGGNYIFFRDNGNVYADGDVEAGGKISANGGDASGSYSTAMGRDTKSSGSYSTAMGYMTEASGLLSTTMGYKTNAFSYASTAMGYNTEASGNYSTSMGDSTIASGVYSTSMGYNTIASSSSSTIVGANGQTASDDVFAVASGINGDQNTVGGGIKFSVKRDGTAYSNGKELATKEYVDSKTQTTNRFSGIGCGMCPNGYERYKSYKKSGNMSANKCKTITNGGSYVQGYENVIICQIRGDHRDNKRLNPGIAPKNIPSKGTVNIMWYYNF